MNDISDDIAMQQQSQTVLEGQDTGAQEPAQVLSKTQMKKLAKRQKFLEKRPEKRRIEKEKKKLKRKELAKQKLENGQPIANATKRTKLMSESSNKFRVVIDMDFEDFMTDSEIAKSAKQVGRIYALNRHSDNPCQLYISSLKGKLRDRFALTNTGYENWDVNTYEEDYLNLFVSGTGNGNDKERIDNIKSKIIYLTGDADETLQNVDNILKDESTIFVIGGLVDHNRHKNLCYQRALERQVKTAKLPIKEHVHLCQRHILSTVAVFEIMLNVLGSRKSWPEALLASIPKRKIARPIQDESNTTDVRE